MEEKMRTVRRLYLYLVAFISLEVVIWGLIGLVRFILGEGLVGSTASQLASGLALIAVGVPVFLLHWWLAGRTLQDIEERFSRLRSVFLYGTLLATLIPVFQNLLAFINRAWLQVLRLPVRLVFIGEGQTWSDNLVAILINGLIALYIFAVLRRDWSAIPQEFPLYGRIYKETRRLYRYIWTLYGLAMVVGGVQQVLYFSLNQVETYAVGGGANLATGLSLVLVGAPLWVYAWRVISQSLQDLEEVQSSLRLVVLYGLSFIGVSGVLLPVEQILDVIFRLLLGESTDAARALVEISGPLSAGISFGVMWLYYGRRLAAEVAALPDTPRRAGLRRIYSYILSFAGLAATFLGLHLLLYYLVDSLLLTAGWTAAFRQRLSMALATLIVGLPLWLFTWRPAEIEAAQAGESGDHARRSLVRKIYLYLVIFSGVIGVMGSGGSLIFQVLSKILGEPDPEFQRLSWMQAELLVLFAVFLVYHLLVLSADNRKAAQALAERHSTFPVLVLANELGDFSEEILEALQRETPTLPVAVHLVDQGIPDETLSAARAVILPAALSTHPTEAIRIWLKEFPGTRLVVPTPAERWLWVFGSGRTLASLASQTARLVRHLAEGEEPPKVRDSSGGILLLYILGGLIGIPLLIRLAVGLGDLFR
jgi:hypothetical protein